MGKQRGYPDRRAMGAESDAISEQFVRNERYKAQQRVMAETLVAGRRESWKDREYVVRPN